MASPSGTSSGSSLVQNSRSEEYLQALRKRKRMISNRESARRSRLRKQRHLDDLTTQLAQLKKENHQVITSYNITTQHYLSLEADNSVLRAQVSELSHRLQFLNGMICFLEGSNSDVGGGLEGSSGFNEPAADSFLNPLNMAYLNQPLMASPDLMFY